MSETETKPAYPVPVPDQNTQAFWDGVARRELLVQRCSGCQKFIWQPRPVCPKCQKVDPVWTRVAGQGRVASWMVIRPPTLPAFAERVPFVILLVELDEGVRMVGYLVNGAGERMQTDGVVEGVDFGRRVEVRYHDQAGTILPCWTLVG